MLVNICSVIPVAGVQKLDDSSDARNVSTRESRSRVVGIGDVGEGGSKIRRDFACKKCRWNAGALERVEGGESEVAREKRKI